MVAISDDCIVVVDPWSTGALAAKLIKETEGYQVIYVLSEECVLGKKASDIEDGDADIIVHAGSVRETCDKLQSLNKVIVGIMPGAETGVLLSDQLVDAFGTRGNRLRSSLARRNKYLMAEQIRSKGIRAVEQVIATEWEQVANFLKAQNCEENFEIIVKPNDSAGSDDVFLCKTTEQVRTAFKKIHGSTNALGLTNSGVLVQEYLRGPEFVIDTVSFNGKHKCTAIWEYHKAEANGQFNVYFGMSARAAKPGSPEEAMVKYIFQVLDALEFTNGPGHAEVKWTETGPCLVEVGSRCAGGSGAWVPLAKMAYGYTQVEMAVAAFTNPRLIYGIPEYPVDLAQYVSNCDLVAYETGLVNDLPGLVLAKNLPSFYKESVYVKKDSVVVPTVDCFTMPGCIQLAHDEESVVKADFDLLHTLCRERKFFNLRNDNSNRKLQAWRESHAQELPQDECPEASSSGSDGEEFSDTDVAQPVREGKIAHN